METTRKPIIKPNSRLLKVLNKNNKILSDVLDIPLIKIKLQISPNSISDFGWYNHNKNGDDVIQLSEFVVGTPAEENIIQHELCHAYTENYFPDTTAHGHNFKELANKIFGHNKVKKPYVNDIHLCSVEISDMGYKIYYKNKLKSVIKVVNNNVLYLDENEKIFKHKNTGVIYGYILKRVLQSNGL